MVDGRRVYTHERLRRARSSLSSPVSAGTPFTYLGPALAKADPLPSTNNMIEGGVNSQLRAVLCNHRGLTSVKRVKAVFWWRHARSGDARTAHEKLATMPTDADIDFLFSVYSASPSREDGTASLALHLGTGVSPGAFYFWLPHMMDLRLFI